MLGFLKDVLAEFTRARGLFPEQRSEITGLALGEECGEAQRALLHIYEGKGGEADLYKECVRTAAMTMRLALERADRKGWKGNIVGCPTCQNKTRLTPCPICTGAAVAVGDASGEAVKRRLDSD